MNRNTLRPDPADPAGLVSEPPVDKPLTTLGDDPLVEHRAGESLPDEIRGASPFPPEVHEPRAGRAAALARQEEERRLTTDTEPLDLEPIKPGYVNEGEQDPVAVQELEEDILLATAEEAGIIPPRDTAPHFRTAVEGFKDVSAEIERTYHYPDGGKATFISPLRLHVSASGGHRLYLADDTCVYLKNDWRYITWKVRDGANHFDF